MMTSPIQWTKALKALADESRLLIIHELLKQEASVSELSNTLGVQIYNISRHLKVLENSGLVEKKRKGHNIIYSISEGIANRFSEKDQVLDLGCCKFTFKDLD
ncbi:MAG: winged helix-turn-helix transcriptional regulator [Nitrospirae bacterium]|nr:winged helix-turn-helix transcriptional regulator [Nitrospirota bacterium]